MSHIFLIGMPGAGKTYWAKAVAAHYDLPYLNMDDYIEAHEHKSISEIFEEQGEVYFRTLEQQALQDVLLRHDSTIIACGGGTPAFFDNMQQMKQRGCTVYLRAALPTLTAHLQSTASQRPLLKGEADIEKKLASLLNERKSFFEQADYILDVEMLWVATFEQIIQSCINRPL